MNYRSIVLAFVGIIVYYSLYGAINPIILGFTGDNSFVEFLTKVIPLVIFFAIIFSAFTGNDAKNYKYSYLLFCGGVFLLFASPVTAGLTDNLIRAYDYQNMSYTDLLGNGADLDMYNFYDGNNGTVSGGVTISDGAMVFDGVDGVIDFPLSPHISTTKNFTLFFKKFKLNSAPSQVSTIFENSQSTSERIALGVDTNRRIGIAYYNGSSWFYLSSTQLTLGIEYNILINYDTSENIWKLYLNNVVQTGSNTMYASGNSGNMRLGRDSGNNRDFINMNLDTLQIYSEILTYNDLINNINSDYSPISDGLVAQYSGRDFAGTESTPTSIIDTYRFTHDTITNTTRLKFNYSDSTYIDGGSDHLNWFPDYNTTISFFTNATTTSRYIFNVYKSLRPDYIAHQEYAGELETGVYDGANSVWSSSDEVSTTYNELRNIVISINSTMKDSNFYYDSIIQNTGTDGVVSSDTPVYSIGRWFNGYWSGFSIWNVSNLTDLQIRLINGGWSYNNRHKTGFAVQNIFSGDFYDDYIIQIEDLTTNIKTNYTPTRGVVFVNLDNSTSYNVTAFNINDDFADLSQEITGSDLEVLFSVYDYNSILINVYDEETKELITDNVTLKYSKDLTTTIINNTGSFYLTDLASGTYQLNLFGDDYLSRYYYVSVVNNANASLNAYLLKTASSLSRAVNVLCGSNPIEDALISFYIAYDPATYTLVAQRYTDGFGQANFFLNPDTTYRIVIEDGDDIYISSVIPTSTPITVNICQDSDQPYNYTTYKDLFSVLLTPENALLDIETTNFTLDVVSSGGYIDSFGIYSTYNSVNYSSTLSNSTSGGSVRIEIPISTAQDLINIFWFVNTTNNESYDGFKIYKTKMFTEKGNSSFFQVFEDYDTEFSGYWKYIFITFIAGMFMLLTAKFIAPQYNAFVGLAIFIFFAYLGWISWAYILPMGAILILYVVVRR